MSFPSTLRSHFVPHFVLRLSVEGSALSARQDRRAGRRACPEGASRRLPVWAGRRIPRKNNHPHPLVPPLHKMERGTQGERFLTEPFKSARKKITPAQKGRGDFFCRLALVELSSS